MGASCQLVEKACYRKICRDGSISALRAAAMRRLRSETRLRAQSLGEKPLWAYRQLLYAASAPFSRMLVRFLTVASSKPGTLVRS